jgi:hypothetical protein
MIQLASDPNASRPGWRPAAADAKGPALDTNRVARTGHAWPFIARLADKPTAQQAAKNTSGDSGS